MDLRAAVPQGNDVLFSVVDSLSDVALAGGAPTCSSKSVPLPTTDWKSWAREKGLTAFPASPFHLAFFASFDV